MISSLADELLSVRAAGGEEGAIFFSSIAPINSPSPRLIQATLMKLRGL